MLNTQVGHYTIRRKIGSGGMGDVYEATDERLGRPVAIKAIRADLREDPIAKRRLEREARAVAALDHPFICKLYELVDDGEHLMLVMEYVDGTSLAQLLTDGPLEANLAARVTRDIAEALAFSHRQGLVHRDIKPANIIVTDQGHAKVLDFGIAKPEETLDPDGPTQLTQSGIVTGTPAYMSPEQASLGNVSTASDVFSTGVLLYQSLSGRLPFEGDSRGVYLRNLLADNRVLLGPAVPERLRELVDSCLDSDPAGRPAAEELAAQLRALSQPAQQAGRRSPAALIAAAAIVVAIVGTIAFVGLGNRNTGTTAPVLLSSEPLVTWPSRESSPALSSDGGSVAFVSDRGQRSRIWVQVIDGGSAVAVSNTQDNPSDPIWSPDDQRLAYIHVENSEIHLRIVTVPAGNIEASFFLAPEPSLLDLVRWRPGGIYLLRDQRLWHVDPETGASTQLTDGSITRLIRSADISPNEERLLIASLVGQQYDLWVSDLDGRDPERLTETTLDEEGVRWITDNAIAYTSGSTGRGGGDIWRLDLGTGTASPLTAGLERELQFDVDHSGKLIVVQSQSEQRDLWFLDPASSDPPRQLTADARGDFGPSVGGDRQVLFQRGSSRTVESFISVSEVLVGDLDADSFEPRKVASGAWRVHMAPSGDMFAYLKPGESTWPELWIGTLDGTERRLDNAHVMPSSTTPHPFEWWETKVAWASDGQSLFAALTGSNGERSLTRFELKATGEVRREDLYVRTNDIDITDLRLSPDGAAIAFAQWGDRDALITLDLQTGVPTTVHMEGATYIGLHGWHGSSLVFSREYGEAVEGTREVLLVDGESAPRLIATLVDARGLTLDRARAVLYYSRSQGDGIGELLAQPLDGSPARVVTSAGRRGLGFSTMALTVDGSIVFGFHERKEDLWLLRF